VAADPQLKVINAYDNAWKIPSTGATVANRTSFVIDRDGKIVYAFTDLNPDKHVENTMAVVKELQAKAAK
jgi:peroxiredoxin